MAAELRTSYQPSSSPARFRVQDPADSTWWELKGVGSWTQSGGARTSTQTETLDGGISTSQGAAGAKQVAGALNAAPGSHARKLLIDAFYSGATLNVEMETAGETLLDNTVEADTFAYTMEGGVLTADGAIDLTNEALWPSHIGIKLSDTQLAILETVSGAKAGVAKIVSGADADIAATHAWERVAYGVKRSYVVRITDADNLDLQTGASLADSFTVEQTSATRNETYVF